MTTFRPLLVSRYDSNGGAARAAQRLHRALLNHGVTSRMLVASKAYDDWRIEGPTSKRGRYWVVARDVIGALPTHLQRTQNQILHSASWFPSRLDRALNRADADVVHLHWVCGETLSIEAIGRIRKPMVWTLHDMWPFCGAEHLSPDTVDARFRVGYDSKNRPVGHSGLDLDKWTWRRKKNSWRKSMQIIAPSHWLADCARSSVLMRDWPIHVIPNSLDTELFHPIDKEWCRSLLGLPQDCPLIMFGAIGGNRDPNKGFDLLSEALRGLSSHRERSATQCVVFGRGEPREAPDIGFPIHWMGHIHDELSLAILYNAVDLVAVPSRQEAFGQVASEAQACGTPVVAFRSTGLLDIIEHQVTGYLAEPFDTDDLGRGIEWLLEDSARKEQISTAARERALALWSPEVVVPQIIDVYQNALSE